MSNPVKSKCKDCKWLNFNDWYFCSLKSKEEIVFIEDINTPACYKFKESKKPFWIEDKL